MKKNLILVLCLAAILLPLTQLADDGSAQTVEVDIRFHDWETQYEGSNMVIVSGYFQEVFIGTSGTNASLTLEYSDIGSGTADETNSYLFVKNSTGWYDVNYDWYLNETLCNSTDDNITFGIGVFVNATLGDWNMIAEVDGIEVFNGTITIEYPNMNLGLSRLDFLFRVEPYATAQERIDSPDYSRLINNGNIPVRLWTDWGGFEDIFEATNASGIMFPGENQIYITLNPQVWSPRSIELHCTIHGESEYSIPKNDTVSLSINFAQQLNIDVQVRLSGYEIIDLNGTIVMQYKQGPITLDYDEETVVDIWLTGINGTDAILQLEAVNITILKVEWDGVEYNWTDAINMLLASDPPEHINITVLGNYSNAQGFLTYNIATSDGTTSGSAITQFQTGPQPPGGDEDELTGKNALALVIIGIGAAVFVGILVVYGMKTKKK